VKGTDGTSRGPAALRFPIATERLSLRPFTLADSPEIDPIYRESWPHWPGPLSESVAETRAHVRRRMALQREHGLSLWLARDRRTGAVLGHCGLQPLEGRGPEVEVGYAFGRAWWGRGLATEGATACVRIAFEELGLERVVAVTMPGNAGSRAVMEKLGMRYERTAHLHGHNQVVYALGRPRDAVRLATSSSKPG
jgi:ribosomal-protein-alanine N-acetyltransferase